MKTLKLLLAATLTAAFLFSCVKEGPEGPAGPAGPAGPTGPAGPAGPQGVAGNANVVLYEYGTMTFTSSVNYLLTDMARGRMDSSMVLSYYNPAIENESAWYAVPGAGSGGDYVTRNFWWQSGQSPSTYTMGVRTHTWTGTLHTTSKTWTKFRIFVVKASVIEDGGKKSELDLDDHDAVCEFLGIKKE